MNRISTCCVGRMERRLHVRISLTGKEGFEEVDTRYGITFVLILNAMHTKPLMKLDHTAANLFSKIILLSLSIKTLFIIKMAHIAVRIILEKPQLCCSYFHISFY